MIYAANPATGAIFQTTERNIGDLVKIAVGDKIRHISDIQRAAKITKIIADGFTVIFDGDNFEQNVFWEHATYISPVKATWPKTVSAFRCSDGTTLATPEAALKHQAKLDQTETVERLVARYRATHGEWGFAEPSHLCRWILEHYDLTAKKDASNV